MRFLGQIAVLFVFVVAAPAGRAQDTIEKQRTKSNLEKISAQDGQLLQKEFIEISKVKSCKIQIFRLTNLVSGSVENGVRFSYEVKKQYSSDEKTAVLDMDEVQALIQSIGVIVERVLPTTKTTYTEVVFTSRGGFQTGCFWSSNSWAAFMKLERYDGDSYVWLKAEDLNTLKSALSEAYSSK